MGDVDGAALAWRQLRHASLSSMARSASCQNACDRRRFMKPGPAISTDERPVPYVEPELPAMVPDELLEGRPPSVRRRLGFDASSPRSYEEYYERRHSGAHRHS